MVVFAFSKKINKNLFTILFPLIVLGYFWIFGLGAAEGATLFLSPAVGSFNLGQTFSLNVYVSSNSQSINAVSGLISFETDKLEVVSLNKNNSIINYWVEEPTFSNSLGNIKFEGIIMNPGYIGNRGLILGINFKTKEAGLVNLTFSSASVLANDGLGTNILNNTSSASINILGYQIENKPLQAETPSVNYGAPPALEIISETHPDNNVWYNKTTAKFSWKLSSDITAIRILLDKNPKSIPNISYSPAITEKTIEGISDGIWYFHLQAKNQFGWGDISHFKIQIDTTSPESFSLRIDNENDPTNPQPELIFEAKDNLSGIDYYEIKIGQAHTLKVPAREIINGRYKIPLTSPGTYSVIIRAFDKAGNYSLSGEELKIEPIKSPIITDYPKQLSPGNPLIIKGEAFSKGRVTIFIEDERKNIISDTAKVEENYKWTFVSSRTLEKGVYKVYAILEDERGAKSSFSESVKVVVSPPVFIRIGDIIIDYLSVTVSLISLVILLIIVWLKGVRRIANLQRKIRKETKEAKVALYQAFYLLKDKIVNEINQFDNKPSLSKKEREIINSLKKVLEEAEEKVAKEIKDIEETTEEK